jgi:hypothetical protein
MDPHRLPSQPHGLRRLAETFLHGVDDGFMFQRLMRRSWPVVQPGLSRQCLQAGLAYTLLIMP